MKEQILNRTKAIGINSLNLLNDLPNNPAGWAIAKQLARCSTSIGANYRAAIRAKSDLDFINKLKIVEEETDETLYWLEVIEEMEYIEAEKTKPLYKETNEILSIIVATINTTRKRINNYK